MIDWIGAANGKINVLDPAFKRFQAPLQRAIARGGFSGLRTDQCYFAAGTEQLDRVVRRAGRKNAEPLILLEGPTPLRSKRVPASIVLVPLGSIRVPQNKTADAMIEAALRKLLDEALSEPSNEGCLAAWRSLGLSCQAAGEETSESRDVEGFAALAAGSDCALDKHTFWRLLMQVCAGDQSRCDTLLECLLSHYTVWFSPYTGEPVHWSEALHIFKTIQDHWQSNECASHCYGAQYWNHPSIGATFSGTGGTVTFHETQEEAIAAALKSKGRILSWAGRTDAAFEAACDTKNIPLLRIEDGFLRSVGLGAGLARGAMLAVDDLGIYYDPSRPSRLEVLLKEYDLSDNERKRAQSLIEQIKSARISKYNFGKSRSYDFPTDRRKILIPGQVADDAAIRKSRSVTIDCANTPNVNLDLLKLARSRNPEAFLIFKPHPDVETGLRKGRVTREEALEYVDAVAEDANIIDLIEVVDGLETFSSLSGFEALLRGKNVVVHGAPFYAGWGLCEDLTEIEGRQRQRSLEELVYLALVQYARTIDPVTLLPCTPEFLVSRLTEQRGDRRHLVVTAIKRHASWLGRKLGI